MLNQFNLMIMLNYVAFFRRWLCSLWIVRGCFFSFILTQPKVFIYPLTPCAIMYKNKKFRVIAEWINLKQHISHWKKRNAQAHISKYILFKTKQENEKNRVQQKKEKKKLSKKDNVSARKKDEEDDWRVLQNNKLYR